ncbi:MAG: DNA polymerase III subunit gamma/tau, partial [Meiothermus sp.]|nr:DNA polymerase III subunit gamma/tau [Meiothermus sp.]
GAPAPPPPAAPQHPKPRPPDNLPAPPPTRAAPPEPAPADTPWEEPHPSLQHPPVAGPPEPEPWNPEASLFDPTLPDEASEEAEARPALEASLLEDPRFQKLVQLFGGRLRKFHPEAGREVALEALSSDAEEEPD